MEREREKRRVVNTLAWRPLHTHTHIYIYTREGGGEREAHTQTPIRACWNKENAFWWQDRSLCFSRIDALRMMNPEEELVGVNNEKWDRVTNRYTMLLFAARFEGGTVVLGFHQLPRRRRSSFVSPAECDPMMRRRRRRRKSLCFQPSWTWERERETPL